MVLPCDEAFEWYTKDVVSTLKLNGFHLLPIFQLNLSTISVPCCHCILSDDVLAADRPGQPLE